jgi:putative Mn2+ efflux pump MntP
MSGRIAGFLREYIVILSILTILLGIVLMFMGIVWYWVRSFVSATSSPIHFIYTIGEWNAYTLVAGLIIFGIGVYYIYSYLKKRKFVLDELNTDKRSEIIKKRSKLESTVKHLPSKYQHMLAEKEDELNIR